MFGRITLAAACFAATVASAAASKWTIVDLLDPWGGQAMAINNRGEVTGWMRPNNGPFHHAFLWSNGTVQDLGVPQGQFGTDAAGMSNNGYVVGNAQNGQAMLWHNGEWTILPQHGTFNDVSESGTAVGGLFLPGNLDSHATMYKDGVITDLGQMGGGWSVAWAINNAGTIVGNASLPTRPSAACGSSAASCTRTAPCATSALSAARPATPTTSTTPAWWSAPPTPRAGAWSPRSTRTASCGRFTEIPGNSAARSVNERGDVVGSSDRGGWLYSNGVLTMLADIPEVRAAGYTSISPVGINDRGWITGTGFKPATGGQSFVLMPK
jgi:probable HAF family extracellular repeat protein